MGPSDGLRGRMPMNGDVVVLAPTLPLATDAIYRQTSGTPSASVDELDCPNARKSLIVIGVPRLIGLMPFIGVFGIPTPIFPEDLQDTLIPLPSISSSS